MKAPHRSNPVKSLAGFAVAYLLIGVAALFFLIASFIWLAKEYGTEIAFAATGAALLICASIMLIFLKRPKAEQAAPLPPKLSNDPLAKYVPDTLRDNSTIQKLLYQVGESPVTATATAVTVGMLLSREFLEER
jgi:hypothetical protein